MSVLALLLLFVFSILAPRAFADAFQRLQRFVFSMSATLGTVVGLGACATGSAAAQSLLWANAGVMGAFCSTSTC